jgi:cobalt-precorrin-5B (C1)-methyltransferase
VALNRTGAVSIAGGDGVGVVTRPGLAIAAGEAAINPVPRQMIERALAVLLPEGTGVEVVISVPGGRELARKTLNPRLGIVGGISILGTTGIVEPYSHSAYRESLVCAFGVLQASGGRRVVLSTGKGSEAVARTVFAGLPESAFILMADYFLFALDQARAHNLAEVQVACYPAKLTKMVAGAGCTHCGSATVDLDVFARAAAAAGIHPGVCADMRRAHTVRHACELLVPVQQQLVCRHLAAQLVQRIRRATGNRLAAGALVVSYANTVLAQVRH